MSAASDKKDGRIEGYGGKRADGKWATLIQTMNAPYYSASISKYASMQA